MNELPAILTRLFFPTRGASCHKSISFLNLPSILLFSFSFVLLLMQIPWLILQKCHFSICRRWKKNNGIFCIHWQITKQCCLKNLNGQKTKAKPFFPSSPHYAFHCSLIPPPILISAFMYDFWAIFKVVAFCSKPQCDICKLKQHFVIVMSSPFSA